jgi:TRAP-type C4-dicarboxylate transport system permease small subunit
LIIPAGAGPDTGGLSPVCADHRRGMNVGLFEKLMQRSVGLGTNTGAVFLVVIMFIICSNVVFRIFGSVIPGTYELVEIMVVVVAGFALGDTEFHHRQTNVDMVVVHLPKRVRLWIENACNLVSWVYWVLIAWASTYLLIDKAARGETTDILKISVIPFRAVWVLGLILICFVIIYNTSKNFTELGRGKS